MSKELKPQIRFKGFEDDWEQAKVNDVFTLGNGYTPSKAVAEYWNDGTIPWFRMEDIRENGRVLADSIQHVTPKAVKSSGLFKAGSIILSTTATIGEHALLIADSLANQRFTIFQIVNRWSSKLTPEYLLYRFYGIGDWCKRNVNAGGLAAVNISDLQKYNIDFPSSEEERCQISMFLSNIDSLIKDTSREIGRLEKMKQASLQKMFPRPGSTTPEIRFAGFTEPWKIKELGTIAEKVSAKNCGFIYDETFSCSAEHGIINQQEFFDHSISKSNKIDGYLIVKPDYFVYNPRVSSLAPFGPIIRNKTGRTGVISPLYLLFKFNEQVDYLFLDWFFKTSYWHNFMKINGDSGARHDRFTIRTEIFFQMPILFPQLEEQKAIGEYFRNLDDVISSKRQKLAKLRQIKQACLDKMFVNATES